MDYMDWIGWEIWNGNGKEYGFPDLFDEETEEEEELDSEIEELLERMERMLEPIRDLNLDD